MKTAILSLDKNDAAKTWRDGCQKLGLGIASFSNGVTALHQLKTFFNSPAEWVFLAGHHIWGPVGYPIETDCSYSMFNGQGDAFLFFRSDMVRLLAGRGVTNDHAVIRGDNPAQFSLQCKVMLMCGCSIVPDEKHPYPEGIADIFELFGPHVLLGFTGSTGWEMFNYMLGGSARGVTKPLAKNFFANLDGETEDQEVIRDAWLDAGIAGYHDPDCEDTTDKEAQVIAVDPDGQSWHLEKGAPKKSTKFNVVAVTAH